MCGTDEAHTQDSVVHETASCGALLPGRDAPKPRGGRSAGPTWGQADLGEGERDNPR